MKYPIKCKNVIDVTAAPYFADNTGKTDCTDALRRVFDDVLSREIEGIKKAADKMKILSDDNKKNTYESFEIWVEAGFMYVTYPEVVPSSRIIYFPNGIYRVSDTVTYTLTNLKNIFKNQFWSELTRGIHVQGESRDGVIIKLYDNSEGFGKGSKKPVISFTNAEGCEEKHCSNVSQLNTIEDLTIDCGEGNDGAVGLRFVANNSGRIENVKIQAKGGYAGVSAVCGSEATISNLHISGFDYGLVTRKSSNLVLQDNDMSDNKIAAIYTRGCFMLCNNINHGLLPLFSFEEGEGLYADGEKGSGVYYVVGEKEDAWGEVYSNSVYVEKELLPLRDRRIPENRRSQDPNDWVCVDDFGAVGDGVTDSTDAIQRAMNSGKSVVIFGEGHYLVDGEISVPATVKTIDFMFCDFFVGENLKNNEGGALFHINEDSDEMLFMENLYTFEQFYGYMHLIKHGARRDLVMSDLHTQSGSMYRNTVGGSNVYIDNCAATTGTYSCNAILAVPGVPPLYSHIIPYEFHGQKVYARQLNPERADVELLNDASEILIDCYKTEGPGTAIKTINGGATYANVISCGIGFVNATNSMIVTENAKTVLNGAIFRGCSQRLDFNMLLEETLNGTTKKVDKSEVKDVLSPLGRRVNHYESGCIEEIF